MIDDDAERLLDRIGEAARCATAPDDYRRI
jgi:hypothetical protein